MDALIVEVSVPVTSFRPHHSRDYQDTYPVPPPSTVFGMLLSLCGVRADQRSLYEGTELAVMVDRVREPSRVLRKMRRDPHKDRKMGLPSYRPEYQEIILGLRMWCSLRSGSAAESLPEAVSRALEHPADVERSGGLSLSENTFLVDSVGVCEDVPGDGLTLHPDDAGPLTLPVWVDYQDATKTTLRRFSLLERSLGEDDYVPIASGR